MKKNTVSISTAKSIIYYLESNGFLLGQNKERFLASLNINEHDIEAVDGRLALDQYHLLWNNAEALTNDLAIGFRIGTQNEIETSSLVSNLLIHSESLKHGIKQYIRFSRLLHTGIKVTLSENKHDSTLKFHYLKPQFYCRHDIERSVVLTVKRSEYYQPPDQAKPRYQDQAKLAPVNKVTFCHAAPSYAKEMEESLNCPIEYNAPVTSISFPSAYLNQIAPQRNPYIYAALINQAEKLQKSLPAVTFSERVASLLSGELGTGSASVESIASKMNMTRQTLYRRLRAEGLVFKEILDQARQTKAVDCLNDQSLSLCEISYNIGFSDSSAFSRAFKRWTGQSPSDYRNQLVSI